MSRRNLDLKAFLLAIGEALLTLLNVEGMEREHDALQKAIEDFDATEE